MSQCSTIPISLMIFAATIQMGRVFPLCDMPLSQAARKSLMGFPSRWKSDFYVNIENRDSLEGTASQRIA